MENSQGLFHYLPLATRSIRKLTDLIDEAMASVGAQRVSLPMLTPAALWKASTVYRVGLQVWHYILLTYFYIIAHLLMVGKPNATTNVNNMCSNSLNPFGILYFNSK